MGKKRPFPPPSNNFPHGLAVLADGSVVIHDGDRGNMVARLYRCGQLQWIKAVLGHHAIACRGRHILVLCAGFYPTADLERHGFA